MAKEFLHKEGLTKLVENIKAWSKGAFLGKDATITKSSGTNKGVSVSIQGSVSEPSVSVSITTSGVSGNNSGIVSGSEVKEYVDANAATKNTFKAATSSSNAVNGLVPAPSSANSTKFLRGDGSWSTPPLVTNNTDGLMGADDKTKLDQSVAMVTPLTGEDGSCILEVERNDGTYLEFQVPKVGAAKEADNAAKVGGKDVKALRDLMFNGDTPRYIPGGTDLNTLYGEDKCGFWNSYDNVDYVNCPITNFGLLVLRINTAYFAQVLLPFDAGNANDVIKYRSQTWDGDVIWNDWREVAFAANEISASASNRGVAVILGGTVGNPTVSVTTTTNGVSAANSGIVSGKEVKDYVDANAATKSVFFAATSSSVGSNGLVPAPLSHQTAGFLRGDGVWDDGYTTWKSGVVIGGSNDSPKYVLLAILPPSTNYTYDMVNLIGSFGGWESNIKNIANLHVGIRDGVTVYGFYQKNNDYAELVLNKSGEILLKCNYSYISYSFSMTAHNAKLYNIGDYTPKDFDFTKLYDGKKVTRIDSNGVVEKSDSANAIGGKGLDDLVQGGGTIKHIKVVTSLPANVSSDTLYLIKQ